jgi:hypothetical protein
MSGSVAMIVPLPENLVILDAQDADSLRFAHNVMFSGT